MALQGLLFGLFVLTSIIGPRWPASVRTPLFVIGVVVAACGGLLTVLGLVHLGPSLTALPKPKEGAPFRTDGMYRRVRHPIYGGLALVVIGGAMTNSPWSLLPAAALVTLFAAKRRVEERWLEEAYPEYQEYRRRVRRVFFPVP